MEEPNTAPQRSNFEKNLVNLADWTVLLGTLILVWYKLKEKKNNELK